MSIAIKRRKVNPTNRLGKCDVCKSTVAIYTCPRCETVTCSLTCVKAHKTQLDCDGVRVRTKYVPVDKMDGSTILSDYRLLEDVTRCVEFAEARRANLDATQPTITDSTDQMEGPPGKRDKPQDQLGSFAEKGNSNQCDSKPEEQKKKHGRKYRKNMRKLHKTTNLTVESEKTVPSKSEVLVAKANRIRDRVMNKTGCKAEILLPTKSEEMNNVDNDTATGPPSSKEQQREPIEKEIQLEVKAEEISEEMELRKPEAEQAMEPISLAPFISLSLWKNSSSDPDKIQNRIKLRKNQCLKTMKRGGRGKEAALETLKKVALKRSIILKLLPHKFQKHYENTSYFLPNENRIYWYLKIAFVNANFSTLSLNQCAETMTVENVIKSCLKRSRTYSTKNKIKDDLEVYGRLGLSKISVLMVADKVPNSQKKFYELDMKKTLQENFVGKCILEYPQLCVALQDCFVAPAVKEEVAYNFFNDTKFEDEDDQCKDGATKKTCNRKRRNGTRKNGNSKSPNNGDCDRESGELTDSSDDEDNANDLFRESEFRSIYTDLLKTIN